MRKLLACFLCLCLLAAPAFASGEASGSAGGRYLTVNADGLTVGESETWTVEGETPVSADAVTGVRFRGGSAGDRFLSVSASEHVDALTDGFTAVIGSDDELWPAPNFAEIYTNEGLNPNSEGFDLDYTWIGQIDWDETSPTYGRYTPVTEAGRALVAKLMPADAAYSVWVEGGSRDDESRSGATQVSVSGGAAALIQNAFIYGEGASGVAISNTGSTGVGSTLVVRDSLLAARAYVPASAGTSENMPNDPLLVTGASRASLSGGESETYYYDSVVTLDGWASLSTDMAGGDGVDLIAVDTFASSLLGGYGTYSDNNCRDYYYGSVLEGAEIGIIISGTGTVSLFDGEAGLPGGAGYGVGLNGDIDPYAYADVDAEALGGSVIAGGRTGVMLHIAGNYKNDPNNENAGGVFSAKDSAVVTDRALLSDEDIEYSVNASWYGRELSPNIEKFINYISGDAILLKSVNATVTLDNAEIDAYSGVLIHSVVNNDTSTVVTPADADPVGNVVTLRNMTADGDILDEDYERPMTLTLDNATLTGRIVSGTAESWTEYWLGQGYAEDYTIGYASNTFGSEAPLDAFVHTLTMNDDGTYEIAEYGESKGTALTLCGGSVWNVAGESSLAALTVEAGSAIVGAVTVDGEAVDVTGGGSWTGAIVIMPADGSAEPSGDASGEASGSASPEPAYVVSDDGLAVDESLVTVELAPDAVVSAEEISGVRVTSTENAAGGLKFTASEGLLKVGGEKDNFTVTTHFTGEELGFNTVIDLREADGYVWGTDSSGGNAIAAKGTGVMEIENVYARNTGIGRYTVNLNTGTTIIKNSYFESAGTYGEYSSMPWFTSQYGNSRCLIACGTLNAYIYNSTVASEGFGSWSTDAGGNPYRFYLYNGDAFNRYGGYGTYADIGLEVHIFGSRFDSAEFGAFVSNSGVLDLGSSEDALEAEDEIFLENLAGQELEEDTPTEIIADQNAIAFHVVDLMTAADPELGIMDSAVSDTWLTMPVLNAKNSILTTDGASYSMEIDFPAGQQAWLDHIKGATIVFRGCCGVANLENVELGSSSGVILMSCLDLDSSAVQILDDIATEDIPGCQINSADNVWVGDIVNEDYQRPMRLDFKNTTLTGAIHTYDIDHWNALFAAYEGVRYVLDEETGRYVNADDPTETGPNYTTRDPGQIYGMLCGLKAYNAVRGTYLSMDADSVWNVTAASNLNSLTVEAGAVISGTVTVDGKTVDVSAGGSWTGDIVVTPVNASGEAS